MSEIRTNTISDAAGTGPVALTGQVALKAWFQYDQTGPTVNGSLNISSISDDAAGQYTPTFTNSMSDANYGISAATTIVTGDPQCPNVGSVLSTSYEGRSEDAATSTLQDNTFASMSIVGSLA